MSRKVFTKLKRNKRCNSKTTHLVEGEIRECRCRGVHGHSGWHWFYDTSGWMIQWAQRRGLRKFDAAGAWTPPGHQSYVSPSDKIAEDFQWGEK